MTSHLRVRVPPSAPIADFEYAGVAKLADALDLGSSVFGRAGSTPVTSTILNRAILHGVALCRFSPFAIRESRILPVDFSHVCVPYTAP